MMGVILLAGDLELSAFLQVAEELFNLHQVSIDNSLCRLEKRPILSDHGEDDNGSESEWKIVEDQVLVHVLFSHPDAGVKGLGHFALKGWQRRWHIP